MKLAENELECAIERAMSSAETLGWRAELDLTAVRRGTQTVLKRSRHVGPLRVQRPFTEANGACQVYVLHPPGGVVGGDSLEVRVHATERATVLLTTPGAGKFYRSNGQWAQQTQHLVVDAGASLEWLPQESIIFDGALAASRSRIELAGDARLVWWEVTCLGRPACNEVFTYGTFSQKLEIFHEGRPVLLEHAKCAGGGAALQAAWGYQGCPVFGTLVVHPVQGAAVEALRGLLDAQLLAAEDRVALTLLPTSSADGAAPSTLVCRYLGHSAVRAKHVFTRLWEYLRPSVVGVAAELPRVWHT